VGGWRSAGKLIASLSDGSSPDFVNVLSPALTATGQYNAVYTLTYRASSASSLLTVKWVQNSGASGNVTLQGVTLVESLPVVNVSGVSVNPSVVTMNVGSTQQLNATVTPANATNQNVTWSSSNPAVATVSASGLLTITGAGTAQVTVTTNDGNRTAVVNVTGTVIPVTSVSVSPSSAQLLPNATLNLTATMLPANATNQNLAWSSSNPAVASVSSSGVVTATGIGTATITLRSVDGNRTATSAITVSNAITGLLNGTGISSSTTVNLTSEGTADWIHWPGNHRKAAGGNKISNYTRVGTGNVSTTGNDMRTCTWSDGAPTANGSDRRSIFVSGIGRGFQFTAPADPTLRTLKVYVGGWQSTGTIIASLSDGSAPEYVQLHTPVLTVLGQYNAVYTLTYKSASAGQSLTVKWVQSSGSTGNVTLQAVTLSEATSPGSAITDNEPGSGTITDVADKMQVYPNPVRDRMQLIYEGRETGRMTVSLFDAAMNRVALYTVDKPAGIWTGTINLPGLTNGFYVVQLRIGNKVINRRIVKM
jgi:uncharacterized protein YjdB